MRQRDIVQLLNDKNVQQAGGFAGCHVRFHTIPQMKQRAAMPVSGGHGKPDVRLGMAAGSIAFLLQ